MLFCAQNKKRAKLRAVALSEDFIAWVEDFVTWAKAKLAGLGVRLPLFLAPPSFLIPSTVTLSLLLLG